MYNSNTLTITEIPRVDTAPRGAIYIYVQSGTLQYTTSTTIPGGTYYYGLRRASAAGGAAAVPLLNKYSPSTMSSLYVRSTGTWMLQ